MRTYPHPPMHYIFYVSSQFQLCVHFQLHCFYVKIWSDAARIHLHPSGFSFCFSSFKMICVLFFILRCIALLSGHNQEPNGTLNSMIFTKSWGNAVGVNRADARMHMCHRWSEHEKIKKMPLGKTCIITSTVFTIRLYLHGICRQTRYSLIYLYMLLEIFSQSRLIKCSKQ